MFKFSTAESYPWLSKICTHDSQRTLLRLICGALSRSAARPALRKSAMAQPNRSIRSFAGTSNNHLPPPLLQRSTEQNATFLSVISRSGVIGSCVGPARDVNRLGIDGTRQHRRCGFAHVGVHGRGRTTTGTPTAHEFLEHALSLYVASDCDTWNFRTKRMSKDAWISIRLTPEFHFAHDRFLSLTVDPHECPPFGKPHDDCVRRKNEAAAANGGDSSGGELNVCSRLLGPSRMDTHEHSMFHSLFLLFIIFVII